MWNILPTACYTRISKNSSETKGAYGGRLREEVLDIFVSHNDPSYFDMNYEFDYYTQKKIARSFMTKTADEIFETSGIIHTFLRWVQTIESLSAWLGKIVKPWSYYGDIVSLSV